MVNVNLREIVREYTIGTAAAVVVNLVMNKMPDYARRIGEERERKALEREEAREKRMMGYMNEFVRGTVKNEIEKYKGEGKGEGK
jgi:hypothetical protein